MSIERELKQLEGREGELNKCNYGENTSLRYNSHRGARQRFQAFLKLYQ